MTFSTTWMDLNGIMLSETSQKEKQILYDLIHMWNQKTPKNPNSEENRFVITRGGGGLDTGDQKVQTSVTG